MLMQSTISVQHLLMILLSLGERLKSSKFCMTNLISMSHPSLLSNTPNKRLALPIQFLQKKEEEREKETNTVFLLRH
jgi:hypothetical protein